MLFGHAYLVSLIYPCWTTRLSPHPLHNIIPKTPSTSAEYPVHQPLEVAGPPLRRDRAFEALDDQVDGILPPHVLQCLDAWQCNRIGEWGPYLSGDLVARGWGRGARVVFAGRDTHLCGASPSGHPYQS